MGKEKYFCWPISSWNGGAAEDCSNSGIDATNEFELGKVLVTREPLRVGRSLPDSGSRTGWVSAIS